MLRVLCTLGGLVLLYFLSAVAAAPVEVEVDASGRAAGSSGGSSNWPNVRWALDLLNGLSEDGGGAFLANLGGGANQLTLVGCSAKDAANGRVHARQQRREANAAEVGAVQFRVTVDEGRRHSFLTLWLERDAATESPGNSPSSSGSVSSRITHFAFSPQLQSAQRFVRNPLDTSAAHKFEPSPAGSSGSGRVENLHDLIGGEVRRVHSSKNPHGADPTVWRKTADREINLDEARSTGSLVYAGGNVGIYTAIEVTSQSSEQLDGRKHLAAVQSFLCPSGVPMRASDKPGAPFSLVCNAPLWISHRLLDMARTAGQADADWQLLPSAQRRVQVRKYIAAKDVKEARQSALRQDKATNDAEAEKLKRIRIAQLKVEQEKRAKEAREARAAHNRIFKKGKRENLPEKPPGAGQRPANNRGPPANCKEASWCRTAPSTKRMPDGSENPGCAPWIADCPCSCANAAAQSDQHNQQTEAERGKTKEQAEFLQNNNPYDVLGVESTCTQSTIRKAFRALSLKYHPDKNLDDPELAAAMFQKISQAYETLSDPDSRAVYDDFGDDSEQLFENYWEYKRSNRKSTQNYYNNYPLVTQLTETIWDKRLVGEELWFVKFYAPWCTHCKTMVNDFKGAASALEGEVEFGAINAETHKNFVSRRFKLSSYPTLIMFSPELGMQKEYPRGTSRDMADLIKFAQATAADWKNLQVNANVMEVRDRDHLVSSEVLNQSLPVVLALITNPNSQAAQSSMSNIVRLSSDLRGQAVVGTVQCRGNGQRRQLCIDVLGRQDNRPHPAIVVFSAGEWLGQLRGTELTSGADDDVPIHWALKIAAIMVNQLRPRGYTLKKDEPKTEGAEFAHQAPEEGSNVNVFPEGFDWKGAEAGGESEESEPYTEQAREATVVRVLSDDDSVEVQYDDGEEELEIVAASRVQVVDSSDDGDGDDLSVSLGEDEKFYDYEDTAKPPPNPPPPPRYDGYSGPQPKHRRIMSGGGRSGRARMLGS